MARRIAGGGGGNEDCAQGSEASGALRMTG